MKMSEHIGDVAMALAKAQGAMRAAQKDRENPFFKSSYATLASVIDAIRDPFSANNLAFTQPTRLDDSGRIIVTTLIMHGGSGQWISGEASASPVKNDPQGVGSLISYLKRYGLQAMVGVASADEDDDGNAATHPHKASAPEVKKAWQSTKQPQASAQSGAVAAAAAALNAAMPTTPVFKLSNSDDQRRLAKVLQEKRVDEALWEKVATKLDGKVFQMVTVNGAILDAQKEMHSAN